MNCIELIIKTFTSFVKDYAALNGHFILIRRCLRNGCLNVLLHALLCLGKPT